MDKKTRKRIDLLQQKLSKLRLQLAGARKQADDPEDITSITEEISQAEQQLRKLKGD